MIINGRSRRCVWWWSKHLQDAQENENIRLADVHQLASDNIHDLLCEIATQGLSLDGCKNPLWIAAINPGPKEQLTEKERDRAREILEKERGLTGQPYFLVEHEKKGWKHWHVVYSRIDAEHMRVLSDSLDAKICHTAARRIENELGLERVASPFDREAGTPRPGRAPEPWEMYRGMQTGIDPRDMTAQVTELYRQSDNGIAFQAALKLHGYELVTGRRGLLILDSAGKEHSLARRIEGVKTKELNAFMRDVDRAALPTVEKGKELHQQRKIAGLEADRQTVRHEIEREEALAKAAIEKEKIERRFIAPEDREKETQAGHRQGRQEKDKARSLSGDVCILQAQNAAMHDKKAEEGDTQPNAKAFAAALEDKGIAFARATAEEAYRSHREAEFAKAIGNYGQRFNEGEIVAVTEPGREYHRAEGWKEPPRVHKLAPANAEKYLAALSLDPKRLPGIEATKSMLNARAEQRAEHWRAIRFERATTINHRTLQAAERQPKAPRILARMPILAFDIVARIFEDLFAPKLTPEQVRHGEINRQHREAEAEDSRDETRLSAELAQQRQQQENEREAARQRERDRGRELDR